MCSHFLETTMDNYQGDLTDILRTTYVNTSNNNTTQISSSIPEYNWQLQSNPTSYSTDPIEDFGDPFSHLRDPLLHDIDTPISSSFFHKHVPDNYVIKNCAEETGDHSSTIEEFGDLKARVLDPDHVDDDEIIKRPESNNIFSRMLQISPNSVNLPLSSSCDDHPAQALINPNQTILSANDHHRSHALNIGSSPNISKANNCLLENTVGLQISSPRNTGIKRRKSQAKKVVCIPAPTPANSRASGEIVPSDLWAWRKYGQKPIKGSPYPRGYYRCSSSKGCSARKQVERSRTDPNMLVITYTSEHNHPWPTQRNALAGSTRSQQSKINNNATSSRSSQRKADENPREESNYKSTVDDDHEAVKEENMDLEQFDDQNGPFEMDDQDFMNEGFPSSNCKPTLQDHSNNNAEDSFFADLGEIEANSNLDLVFRQGFSGAADDDGSDHNKGLDPFSFYDWSGTNNNNNSIISSEGGTTPKRDS